MGCRGPALSRAYELERAAGGTNLRCTWRLGALAARHLSDAIHMQVSRSADGLAEAFSQIRVNDRGQRVVVPISA